jgi:hypothetical protein
MHTPWDYEVAQRRFFVSPRKLEVNVFFFPSVLGPDVAASASVPSEEALPLGAAVPLRAAAPFGAIAGAGGSGTCGTFQVQS